MLILGKLNEFTHKIQDKNIKNLDSIYNLSRMLINCFFLNPGCLLYTFIHVYFANKYKPGY